MYTALLHTHSIVRWVLFLLLLCSSLWGTLGVIRQAEWSPAFRKIQAALVGIFHLQFLLGMVLYVGVSPLMKSIFKDFGGAMKDSMLRFWAIEHLVLMFLALLITQVTAIKVKRAEDVAARYKISAIGFTLALVLVCAGIPWPFREHIGRALLPF